MAVPFRRVLARHPCDIPVDVLSFISETRLAQGRFINLSVSGALFECASSLQKRVTYLFGFSWKKTAFELPGQVAWLSPRGAPGQRSYQHGIQFSLVRSQEEPLRILVERLRRSAEPPPGRDILRDYWKR